MKNWTPLCSDSFSAELELGGPRCRCKPAGRFVAKRAAEDLAIRTNTEIITMIDGKVVRLTAEEIIKRREADGKEGGSKTE